MEIAFTILGVILSIVGVYYAREQVLAQRQEKLSKSDVTLIANVTRGVLKKVMTKKILRVGCLWYPPFVKYEFEKKSVVASGYYPEILKVFAKSQNINIHFSVLTWHEAISAISNGTVDVVACVLKSADRRANCDFVGTVFRVGVGAVIQSGNTKIRNQGDLGRANVTIAVTKGEIGWNYATENHGLATNPVKFTVLEDKNIQTMMSLVERGIVDCALADSLSCSQFIENSTKESQTLSDVFATTPIHVEDNALMIAKGNRDFAEWLQSGIDEIRSQKKVKLLERDIELRYPNILHRSGA